MCGPVSPRRQRVEEVRVEDQQTCGKGLAENAVLPRKLGAVGAAIADVLENHMQALDFTDPNAKTEHGAYAKLVDALRRIAAELRSTADQMAGCKDLPMGSHDAQVMTSPDVLHTFEDFVKAKQELHALLERQAAQDEEMLAQLRRAIGSASWRYAP
jgi:methyl-accepting chemotaxis protein